MINTFAIFVMIGILSLFEQLWSKCEVIKDTSSTSLGSVFLAGTLTDMRHISSVTPNISSREQELQYELSAISTWMRFLAQH